MYVRWHVTAMGWGQGTPRVRNPSVRSIEVPVSTPTALYARRNHYLISALQRRALRFYSPVAGPESPNPGIAVRSRHGRIGYAGRRTRKRAR